MNKWLPAIAFSVLLLVPGGAQNAFAQLCPLITGCTTGNLYVIDTNPFAIKQYNSAGTLLIADFASGLNVPFAIALDSAGNLYVADVIGTVRQYNSAGTLLDANFITGGLVLPRSIVFDSAGKLYVGDVGANTVRQYNSAGTLLNQFFITGVPFPNSIAFDSAGNLYVADAGLQTVGQYSSAGTLLIADFAPGLVVPTEIAFDFTLLPIGGKIVPIDSAALLLAGVQSFSWMIPVVLSGIGIGLFVVSRKSE